MKVLKSFGTSGRANMIKEPAPYSKAVCWKCHKTVDTILKKGVPFQIDVGEVIIDAYYCIECNEIVSIPHSETSKLQIKRRDAYDTHLS